MELVMHEGAVKHSTVYHIPDGKSKKPIFPGVVSFKNKLGGTVVSFAGTPKAAFTYIEGFSFLNESRKAQMTRLLKMCGECPIHYTGDAEVYFRAGELDGNENEMLCAFFNIGLDPIFELEMAAEKPVKSIEKLGEDGTFAPVEFKETEDGFTVNSPAWILDPVILRVRF